MNENLKKLNIETPVYLCDLSKVRSNLNLLKSVAKKSGAKILCALKGFAFSGAMPLVSSELSGATCSGLHEALYASECGFKQIHVYSPAFKESEMEEILKVAHHVVFNSVSQLLLFKERALKAGVSVGLRVNPESSASPVEAYDPCGRFSRLGVRESALKEALGEFPNLLKGVEGLHFHALCEEDAESLERVLEAFEARFGEFFGGLKWLNFGGGHHITRAGYNVKLLVKLVKDWREKYGVEVFLEPGEAVGWQTGDLVARVLDIVKNERQICIIDASPECHMPDTVLMPYRPRIKGEVAMMDFERAKFCYLFGGATCLAGDVCGVAAGFEEYFFEREICVGDLVVFEDQIHYSVVKNTTFNGVALPHLAVLDEDGTLRYIKKFGYEEFRRRN